MEEKEAREMFCPYCGGKLSGIRGAGASSWIHCYSCHTDFTVRQLKEKEEELRQRREVPQGCFEQMP